MVTPPADRPITRLAEISASHSTAVIVGILNLGSDDPFVLRRLDLRANLQTEFRAAARGAAIAVSRDREVEYEPGYTPSGGEVSILNLDEQDLLFQLQEKLKTPTSLPIYSESENLGHNFDFYAVVFHKPDTPSSLFLRRFTNTNRISTSKKIAFTRSGNSYDKLENEVFLFDLKFDIIMDAYIAYLVHPSSYETTFEMFDDIRDQGIQIASEIHGQVPIDNFGEFEQACSTYHMARKLKSIRRKGYLIDLTFDKLKAQIDRYELDITIVEADDGSKMLRFDASRQNRWHILKLLDDDYVHSEMTDIRYAANSKQVVS